MSELFNSSIIKGLDLSYVKRVEDKGGIYKDENGDEKDVFEILIDNNINYARFRIWNNPREGYCSPEDVIALSKRAKKAGLKILIDFHYSDFWADPEKQKKPKAWKKQNIKKLEKSIYLFTFKFLQDLEYQNISVDMVQIGNEITHGILWPTAKVNMNQLRIIQKRKWKNLSKLLISGIEAVRKISPKSKIMIQIASGDKKEIKWFFDALTSYSVPYDLIGISYYHNWHGSIQDLESYIKLLINNYDKDVLIVETSYPFSYNNFDQMENVFGLKSKILYGYPVSINGQAKFIQDLLTLSKKIPNSRCLGLIYWGGEWISAMPDDKDGSTWENQALFNFDGKALKALSVFRDFLLNQKVE